jgi:hypothetical protein
MITISAAAAGAVTVGSGVKVCILLEASYPRECIYRPAVMAVAMRSSKDLGPEENLASRFVALED